MIPSLSIFSIVTIDNYVIFQEVVTNHRSRMCSPCNGSLHFSVTACRRKRYFVSGIWYFSKVTKYSLERHSPSGKVSQSEF